MMAERFDDQRSKTDRTLAAVVLILGASIGYTLIRTLGNRSFWYDEAYTYCFVTASWANFCSVIRHLDIGVAFYYVVVRVWSALFGTSEVALRSFSVAFALFSVIALYYLTAEFFPRRVALTASALLLCNSFWFQQAQTARVYSFAGFLVIVASLAFVRALRNGNNPRWTVAYFVIMLLLVASQLAIALGLFAAHTISFSTLDGRRMKLLQALPLLIGLSIFFALAIYVITSVGATLLHTPVHVTLKSVWVQLASLLGRKASLAILGALATFGIALGARADRSKTVTLVVWTVVPIALIITMSLLNSAALGGRYMYSALFPFLMLAAHGIWAAKRLPTILGALVIALLAEGYGLDQYLKEPWRDFDGRMMALTSGAQNGDAVVFVPPFLAVRTYTALHYSGLELRDGVQTFPAPLDDAWRTVDQRMLQPEWGTLPTIDHRRLWIVTMAGSDSPDGTCDAPTSDIARLHPARMTVLCLGRE